MTVGAARLAATAGAVVAVLGLVAAPAAATGSGVKWSACPPEVSAPRGTGCARVAVPLDYADPSGKQLDLLLSAAGSLDAPEVLVVNPGGPGESGIGTPKQVVASMSPELRDRYLVVGFDPRGVGASSPVDCGDALLPAPMPPDDPADAGQEEARVKLARTIADTCVRRAGDLVRHITTQDAARDLDRIRAALGKDRLDYLGYSYGTKLGATYATMFPERAGKMVLDSVVDPTVGGYQQGFEQDPALQHRAEQFFAWVAKHDATYHLGTSGARVSQYWQRLRGDVTAKPVEGKAGGAELDHMLASTMYTDTSWPTLASAVSSYRAGEPGGLTSAAEQLAQSGVDGPQLAYNCADDKWPTDWATWHADTTRAAAKAPLFAWLNTWFSAPCAFWRAPTAPPLKIGSGKVPPALLVQAKDDPATPLPGAQRMQQAIRGSRMVLSEGGNHGQFLFDRNRCVDQPVTQYLLTGKLPATDVRCAASPAPDA